MTKTWAQEEPSFIKVHFIYGSKPKCHDEKKWFGGIHGGHVGIEYDSGSVIDFAPEGSFHYVAKEKRPHSAYTLRSIASFWNTFTGFDSCTVRRCTIVIPILAHQRQRLDSLVQAYTSQTPYDYAFLGMRCASATYDILAKMDILKDY
ncbi:MAG: hypothetical protein LPK45_03815, partial [Bacteroidota bacterium]|nr:hypothetical protein [Bacteroidota bacterium]MDX5430177.1 hypothetical protein [Bacteroidota bacterium]MDX5468940.1 hypothetical protein [Bacteroidota bacterium]